MLLWAFTFIIIFGQLKIVVSSDAFESAAIAHNEYVLTPGIGRHKVHSRAKTWDEARLICQEEAGDLTIINSENEADVVAELIKLSFPHKGSVDPNYVHIGFHDRFLEGNFVTIENESLAIAGFNTWRQNQPNDKWGIEDCGAIHKYGLLNDISCNQTAAFVCERSELGELLPAQVDIDVDEGPLIEGTNISITCNVKGHPTPDLVWFKDDDIIVANDRIEITANKLTIYAADKNDTGAYTCDATNGYTCDIRTVNIVVIHPEPVKVNISMSEGPFHEGNEIGIACGVSGYPIPTVNWYKDDNRIITNDKIKISENKLLILAAGESDTGQYRCVAANGHTTSQSTVNITVIVPVDIDIGVKSVPFLEGSEIRITCNISGYPISELRWFKDEKLIVPNNMISYSEESELIISAAEKSNTGKYRCEATNGYTSHTKSLDVIVVVPVKVKILVDEAPIYEGNKISIACNVDGYPTPTLLWYKNDNLIQSNNRIMISANKLNISAAEKSDTGKYRCEATNKYSSGAYMIDIKIAAKPKPSPVAANGYTLTTGIGRHKVHSLAKTWAQARSICREEGGDLAIINSKKESEVIANLFKSSLPHIGSSDSGYAHIGFHDHNWEGHYITIEAETLVDAGFNEWTPGEPNNSGQGDENCGSVTRNGQLNDLNCNLPYAFVCERPEYEVVPAKLKPLPVAAKGYTLTPGIGRHKIHRQAKKWDEARLICQEEGGDLAIINSEQESRFISKFFELSLPHTGSENSNYAHVGFHDRNREGRYVTIEGNTLAQAGFNRWDPGEPNNGRGLEHCGSISKTGLLNDIECARAVAFICERPEYEGDNTIQGVCST